MTIDATNIPAGSATALESDADCIAVEAREQGHDPQQYAQWVQEAQAAGMDVDAYIAQRTEEGVDNEEAEAAAT